MNKITLSKKHTMFSMKGILLTGLFVSLLLVSKEAHANYGYATETTIIYKGDEPYDVLETGEYFEYDDITEDGIMLGKYNIKSSTCITGDILNVMEASECPLYVVVLEDTFALDSKTLSKVDSVEEGSIFEVSSMQKHHYETMLEDDSSILIPKSSCKEIYQFVTHKVKHTFPDTFTSSDYLEEFIKSFAMPTLGKNNAQLQEDIVNYACTFVGKPYIWGGTNPNIGADCSGFIQYVYNHFGYSLPRCSYEQVRVGQLISSKDELQPGDLLFNYKPSLGRVGHVIMYIGNGKCVEAKGKAYGICITDLDWNTVYKAKRILED